MESFWRPAWDQVDTKRGLLTLPTSESGKLRYTELSGLVLETLARIPRHLGEPRYLPGLSVPRRQTSPRTRSAA